MTARCLSASGASPARVRCSVAFAWSVRPAASSAAPRKPSRRGPENQSSQAGGPEADHEPAVVRDGCRTSAARSSRGNAPPGLPRRTSASDATASIHAWMTGPAPPREAHSRAASRRPRASPPRPDQAGAKAMWPNTAAPSAPSPADSAAARARSCQDSTCSAPSCRSKKAMRETSSADSANAAASRGSGRPVMSRAPIRACRATLGSRWAGSLVQYSSRRRAVVRAYAMGSAAPEPGTDVGPDPRVPAAARPGVPALTPAATPAAPARKLRRCTASSTRRVMKGMPAPHRPPRRRRGGYRTAEGDGGEGCWFTILEPEDPRRHRLRPHRGQESSTSPPEVPDGDLVTHGADLIASMSGRREDAQEDVLTQRQARYRTRGTNGPLPEHPRTTRATQARRTATRTAWTTGTAQTARTARTARTAGPQEPHERQGPHDIHGSDHGPRTDERGRLR